MPLVATYDAPSARVVLAASGLNAATARTEIRRWEAGEPQTDVRADLVRGGNIGAATSGTVYDREFAPGAANVYEIRSYNAGGTLLDTFAATQVTPAQTATWLRSVLRPFLDRPVTVADWSEVETPARGAVFEILSRRDPIAVTELRGSRRFVLTLDAADATEADALDDFLSFGDVVLLQTPGPACPVPRVYAYVGDVTRQIVSRKSPRRRLQLPLTEVAAPDPALVGYSATWGGITAAFATWTTVTTTFATWTALNQYVSLPVDEIVG